MSEEVGKSAIQISMTTVFTSLGLKAVWYLSQNDNRLTFVHF